MDWNLLTLKDGNDITNHWNNTFAQFPIETVYWDYKTQMKTPEDIKEELLKEDNIFDVIIKDDKVYALRDKRIEIFYDLAKTPCVFSYLEDFKKKWIGKTIDDHPDKRKIQDIYLDKINKWLMIEFTDYIGITDSSYLEMLKDWSNSFPTFSTKFTWKYKSQTPEQIKEELLKDDKILEVKREI